MRNTHSESYRLRTSLSLLLLGIREKSPLLTRKHLAGQIGMSTHTIADAENRQDISGKHLLRMFHYYIYLDLVSPAEFDSFFYLFYRLKH